MTAKNRIDALVAMVDPARELPLPPAPASAAALIALAESPGYRTIAQPSRRLVLAGAAAALAAGGGVAVAVTRAGHHAHAPAATGGLSTVDRPVPLGPVVRPAAFQYAQDPPSAGGPLRTLAVSLAAAEYEQTSGRYTYVHVAGWTSVTDDRPGGDTQVIHPQDKQLWYAADGSGRIVTTPMPAVYPNEQSRRYWQQRRPSATPTGQPTGRRQDDLPAGMAGPSGALPTDPGALADRLDVKAGAAAALRGVRDAYSVRALPVPVRRQILRILAGVPGLSWRGTVADRAGRSGVGVSADTAKAQVLLIFEPRTGVLLAYDEVERPTDTVAGAVLFLGYRHTDQLG